MKCRAHYIIKQERKRNDCSPENIKKLEKQCLRNMLNNKTNNKNNKQK